MTAKTATAELDGAGLRLIARTGSGHAIVIDDADRDAGAAQTTAGSGWRRNTRT